MKKTIELTIEQAREMLGKNETMDALIRANFTEQELNQVKRWKDLCEVSGWYVSNQSKVYEMRYSLVTQERRNIFAKKTQAEGVLAMAQLSQLMKDVNGDWTPDWSNDDVKFTIECRYGKLDYNTHFKTARFLAFPTKEICDKFAEDHRELILEYFKIYQ